MNYHLSPEQRLQFAAINAIHYRDLQQQELRSPAPDRKKLHFRKKQAEYYENLFCSLQGPEPLMQLGFVPNNLCFTIQCK